MSENQSGAGGTFSALAIAKDDGPRRLDRITMLCRTANLARRHLEATVLHDAHLTWTSYDVLHLAVMYRPIDTGVVAALANVSKGSVTRSASDLIRRGLLQRSIPATDRRRSLLAPTAEGWILNQQLRAQLVASLNTLLNNRSGTDHRDIVVLRQFITAKFR